MADDAQCPICGAVLPRHSPGCDVSRDELRIAELEHALQSLDGPISWMSEHYPKAMREMPSFYARAIRDAGRTLAG